MAHWESLEVYELSNTYAIDSMLILLTLAATSPTACSFVSAILRSRSFVYFPNATRHLPS